MVVCLERSADLHIAQLMPLPPTVSCFSKIQIGFTFLVAAHPGSPGQRAVKRVCVTNTQWLKRRRKLWVVQRGGSFGRVQILTGVPSAVKQYCELMTEIKL